MPRRTGRLAALAFALCLLIAAGGCAARNAATAPPHQGRVNDLGSVEIREYRGAKLGSVTDFRENSIKGPQRVDIATYRLKVRGEVATPLALTYEEVLSYPSYRKVTTLNCVEGWSVKVLWEGVRIGDLLKTAGYSPKATVVIFHCADGFTTSLPLDFVVDKNILLAYGMNDIVLPIERGYPFEVVAEDKWGYKWARWVTEIEVSSDTGYKGYWETRGYDNGADLPGK
jgi:DMSO/TMAO reductase YedYZ molybdopterin-dependent catalytic subunit